MSSTEQNNLFQNDSTTVKLGNKELFGRPKIFLKAKSSLSLWSKWQIGHGKWFLNTNLFLIKPFLIAKFDCTSRSNWIVISTSRFFSQWSGYRKYLGIHLLSKLGRFCPAFLKIHLSTIFSCLAFHVFDTHNPAFMSKYR